MHNLKFGVLVCGVLGLIGVFLPMISFGDQSISLWAAREAPGGAAQVYMVMAGFAAAAAMGAMGAAKGMQRWMSIVAIIGFAFVLFKFRDGLFDLFKMAIGAKLMGIGAFAGLVFAILTLTKPEPAK
ncbi:MAG: hypothetical protein H0T89_28155 [Deltaproteobacteria bacterium]|nr:hypothetical protein [Deltaproteobacteria bacterium]MDQ3297766.1 hypothetical protein [Myxococcota bacterium]